VVKLQEWEEGQKKISALKNGDSESDADPIGPNGKKYANNGEERILWEEDAVNAREGHARVVRSSCRYYEDQKKPATSPGIYTSCSMSQGRR